MKYTALAFLIMFCAELSAQCASSATSTLREDILNVTIGTLNNTSTCATTGGAGSILNRYSNYTAIAAPTLSLCSVVPFSVRVGTCGLNYANSVAIYIDWNNDLDFIDPGENVYLSAGTTSGAHTESGNISVPSTAVLGNIRMRVISDETTPGSITPCGTYTYGETEDYILNIVAGPMAYISSTTSQLATSSIIRCMTNQQIVKVEVVVGSGCSGTITQFNLGPGSSTNLLADVTGIHIYYTGTTNTFIPSNEFLPGGTVPGGATNTISGSQLLSPGTNYFWITYDVNPSAPIGNSIDGSCTQITYRGTNYVPTVTNPAGSGTVDVCQSPGAVISGLDVWIKANAGISGGAPITAWANQNTGGSGIIVNGGPNINTSSTAYNYNPYVDFAAPSSPRQYLSLRGFDSLAGKNYSALFFVCQLNDLSRVYTHVATVNAITYGMPVNGTLHGSIMGASAAILENGYDATDFGSLSPVDTWQRNANNILSTSVHTNSKQILSASSSGVTTINRFLGGQDDDVGFSANVRDFRGYVSELIAYTGTITPVQRQRIHSYLAVKYGVTLSSNYLNAAGTTIFTTASPYDANIIGISRQDDCGLVQKQSHNNDDTVRLYLSSLAGTNAANAGSFASNNSSVITGANTGRMYATAASNAEVPAGITSRIEREWQVTNTNFNGSFNMSFVLSSAANLSSVNPADLRLLIDDDGNFTNATVYAPGGGLTFSYSNPVITVSGISTTQIASGATRYLTIGSTNSLTPLPVELLSFTGECSQNAIDLKWNTATETNNHYFTIQKSAEGISFESLADIPGHGTSAQMHTYSYRDQDVSYGPAYYRLKQTNYNGRSFYYGPISIDEQCIVTGNHLSILNLYPNPSSNRFLKLEYGSDKNRKATLSFKNVLGQELYAVNLELGKGPSVVDIDMGELSPGIYFVQLTTGELQSRTLKLVRE